MSLSSTMWTSVSGLLGHGKKMNTIGNNIANINTIGFKGQRMDFADFVYQDTNSLAGPTQNGFGVQVGAIMGNFNQGAFESTQESTDLAINGKGFFQVQKVGSDEAFYTRAGNFRFNPDGYLNEPSGMTLQGWRIPKETGVMEATGGSPLDVEERNTSRIQGTGAPTDIKLDTWNIFPEATTKVDFRVNLPRPGEDKAQNAKNPFAALFETWDGTQPPRTAETPPIGEDSYAKQTSLEIYDEAGVKHNVTVYFDKVDSADYGGGSTGEEVWEYIVTMDPAEDKRQYWENGSPAVGTPGTPGYEPAVLEGLKNVNETKAGGLLMSGTMTYSEKGSLVNQSAYTWGGSQSPATNPGSFEPVPDPAGGFAPKNVINLDPTDMDNWEPATISSSGYPMIVPNFAGVLDAQTSGTAAGANYNTEINFGVKASNLDLPWQSAGSLGDLSVPPYRDNGRYSLNNPNNGPEFVLLNPDYNARLDDHWNPLTNQYDIGGTAQWVFPAAGVGVAPGTGLDLFTQIQRAGGTASFNYKDTALGKVTQADYQKMLELYGVESITVDAGDLAAAVGGPPAVGAIPNVKIKIDLVTGAVTDMAGNPIVANPAAVPPVLAHGGVDLTNTAHADILSTSITDAMDAAKTVKNLYMLSAATPSNANDLAEFTEPAIIAADASTNVGTAFTSHPKKNGYGFGDLTGWSVDQDGVLHGTYSNGENMALWQLTMFDFTNPQGLRREGNNLFTETRDSGDAKLGPAGSGGLGVVHGYSLEQSNVDMSTEFVYMISTQRGYQSNSKLITTTDQMLETVINMKR